MGGSIVGFGKFGSVANYVGETSETVIIQMCQLCKLVSTKCVFAQATMDLDQYVSVSNIASRIRIASGIWNFSYCKATGRLHATVSIFKSEQ